MKNIIYRRSLQRFFFNRSLIHSKTHNFPNVFKKNTYTDIFIYSFGNTSHRFYYLKLTVFLVK